MIMACECSGYKQQSEKTLAIPTAKLLAQLRTSPAHTDPKHPRNRNHPAQDIFGNTVKPWDSPWEQKQIPSHKTNNTTDSKNISSA